MFVNQNRLRHLLRPEHYRDAEHYELELDRLFRPNWQFACTRSEVANQGDFITLNMFGTPVIIRNFGDRNSGDDVRAFQNVCPHRHSMLTCQDKGNSEAFKCQYHGWEFNAEGRTGRIPEAKCFRPWDRENAHLNKIRLEMVGDLIFIHLDENAISLREWMGEFYDEIAACYQAPMWRMGEAWEFDVDSNWKVPVENTLESYHIAEAHPHWFNGGLPEEVYSEHRLEDDFTTLHYKSEFEMLVRQSKVSRQLGKPPRDTYSHYHLHPNLVFCLTDSFNYLCSHMPTSPTTVRVRTRMFPLDGPAKGPYPAIVRHFNWTISRKTMKRIFNEDRTLYDAQQKGIQSSTHPGVIGTREERIHQFQKYVCDQTGIEVAPDGAAQSQAKSEPSDSSTSNEPNVLTN